VQLQVSSVKLGIFTEITPSNYHNVAVGGLKFFRLINRKMKVYIILIL